MLLIGNWHYFDSIKISAGFVKGWKPTAGIPNIDDGVRPYPAER